MNDRTSNISTAAIVISSAFLVMLNQQMLSPALPAVMETLEVGPTAVQWLQSAYAMVLAIMVPLSAYLLGRFSTRKLLIGSLIIFMTGSVLCAFAPMFGVVLAGRMVQALAAGIMTPMTVTIIMLSFPKEKRGTAMGITSIVMSIAPALGPSLSGTFVDNYSWRSIFLLSLAIAGLLVVFSLIFLKNFEGFEKGNFDLLSVVMSTAGLLALLYGLSAFSEDGKHLISLILMICGIVIVILFGVRQNHLDKPILNIKTLKTRVFRISAVAPAFMQAVMYGAMVIMPIFIQNVLGCSATVSGLVMLPGAIFGAITAFASGILFDRYGVRTLVIIGGGLLAISGIALALMPMYVHLLAVILAYTAMSIGIQCAVTPLKTWGLNSLDNSLIAHGTPIQSTFVSIGGSLGTAAVVSIGNLANLFYPVHSVAFLEYAQVHVGFMAMAGFALIYFFISLGFVRDR